MLLVCTIPTLNTVLLTHLLEYLWHASWHMQICVLHSMGLLPDTENCGLRMHRECRERFPRHRIQSKPSRYASRHVRDARAVMHVGIAQLRWREKRTRQSRCLRNPQFYVSGKWPIVRVSVCVRVHSIICSRKTGWTVYAFVHSDSNICHVFYKIWSAFFQPFFHESSLRKPCLIIGIILLASLNWNKLMSLMTFL